MTKTISKPKKLVKAKAKKKVGKKTVAPKSDKKLYTVEVHLNDKIFNIETDDIQEAILSTKQDFLRTKVIVRVTKDEKTLERFFYLQQGKMLFINKFAMDTLLKNLIF